MGSFKAHLVLKWLDSLNRCFYTAPGKGNDTFNEVRFMLSFVQSLLSHRDSVTTGHNEYPWFTIECVSINTSIILSYTKIPVLFL